MEHSTTRPEIVLAALLHLLTAYPRGCCPSVASCIARHFAYLARHPSAHRLIREVSAAAVVEWENAAGAVDAHVGRGRVVSH